MSSSRLENLVCSAAMDRSTLENVNGGRSALMTTYFVGLTSVYWHVLPDDKHWLQRYLPSHFCLRSRQGVQASLTLEPFRFMLSDIGELMRDVD
jgi:hypothetical protein